MIRSFPAVIPLVVLSCASAVVAPANAQQQQLRPESPLALASLAISAPRGAQPPNGLCQSIWTAYAAAPTVGNLVALVSVVSFKAPQAGTIPCKAELLPPIQERVLRGQRDVEMVVLQLAAAPESITAESLRADLATMAKLADGTFFVEASPAEQLILRAAVCRPLGVALAGTEGAGLSTFAQHCLEREARRRFISSRSGQ